MFSGIFEHSIDEKGRISLPSKLRDICLSDGGNSVVITTHFIDPCLQLYTIKDWNILVERIGQASAFSKPLTTLRRSFVAPAMECQADSHSRLVIPSFHRQHAHLTKDVLWVGIGNCLELWDKASYYQWRSSNSISDEELNAIAGLGL